MLGLTGRVFLFPEFDGEKALENELSLDFCLLFIIGKVGEKSNSQGGIISSLRTTRLSVQGINAIRSLMP